MTYILYLDFKLYIHLLANLLGNLHNYCTYPNLLKDMIQHS